MDPAAGRDARGNLFIRDGILVPPPPDPPAGVPVIDARRLVAAPGFMDLHVHLREPGNEAAETVASGCAAAARGGFTTVVAMPNTNPPLDTPARIAALRARAEAASPLRVLPAPCLTAARAGQEVAELEALAAAGAVAFTDDGNTVSNEAIMRQAMSRAAALRLPVMDHALDPALAGRGVMHEGVYSRQHGLAGIPSEAEERIVARDIRLARETGCAIHIQHLSAAGSVQLIRAARREGLPVTAELTPHHLALTDADVDPARPDRHKMNPPVRSAADREALIEGLREGVISCFATDHAPHTQATKALGFAAAPFGVVGLETAVGITYSLLVAPGRMGLAQWVALWTTGPAAVLGLPPPTLAPGTPANLVLLDLESSWVVAPETFASKSRNTPFEGWTLTGQAVMTVSAGRTAFALLPADGGTHHA